MDPIEEHFTNEYGTCTFTLLPKGKDIVFHATWGGTTSTGKEEWFYLRLLRLTDGGTNATNAADAKTNLGLAIGTDIQAYSAALGTIAALSNADGNFIVGDGTNWTVESGATARASLGVPDVYGDFVFDAGEVTAEVAADNTRVSFDMESV